MKENNILSFEGMSETKKHDYSIIGIRYSFRSELLDYLIGSEASPTIKNWGRVQGVKMIVGTPFNDRITMSMNHDYVIRQTKGRNKYILETTSWDFFKSTIDDQSEEPGKLTIVNAHTSAGEIKITDLVFSNYTRTLYIYGRKRKQRWHIRGRIFFNRRREGFHKVRTEADGVEKRLNELPDSFSAPGESEESFDSGVDYQYYFDRSLRSGDCGVFKVFLHPPEFQTGKYRFYMYKRKNNNDFLIMTSNFVNKCIKRAERSIVLVRTGFHSTWKFQLIAPGGIDSVECPGKDFELDIAYFEKLLEQGEDGKYRLVVDLYRDKRVQVDIATELKKLGNAQEYQFDKNVEGNLGIPQVVLLKTPKNANPSQALTYNIDMKGGQRLNEDSLVFTEELRNWLKERNRKLTLTKETGGNWKIEITKDDGTATHTVNLKNIERIDYRNKPGRRSLIQPVIPDLATETESPVDLETVTAKYLRWNKTMWPDYANDCKKNTE